MYHDNASRKFKLEAIKAAKDLNYGKTVIAQIKAAKTDEEVSRIMCLTRNRMTW